MLNSLGTIPEEYSFSYLECTIGCDLEAFLNKHSDLKKYKFIKSSDAHFLGKILEPVISMELPEKVLMPFSMSWKAVLPTKQLTRKR